MLVSEGLGAGWRAWRSYLTHGTARRQRIREEQVAVRPEDTVAFAGVAKLQLPGVGAQAVESRFDPHDEVRRGAGDRNIGEVGDVRLDVRLLTHDWYRRSVGPRPGRRAGGDPAGGYFVARC